MSKIQARQTSVVYSVTFALVVRKGYHSAEWMSSTALLTGAQFLFLTDDSGVGNAHGEPHIPFYHVEKLNALMARVISGEVAGKRIAPEARDILRTVGKPIN